MWGCQIAKEVLDSNWSRGNKRDMAYLREQEQKKILDYPYDDYYQRQVAPQRPNKRGPNTFLTRLQTISPRKQLNDPLFRHFDAKT